MQSQGTREILSPRARTLSVAETYHKPPSVEVLTVFLVISQCHLVTVTSGGLQRI